jgi:hypothetical protein
MNARSRQLVIAVLAGGISAGTIDIGAACLINGKSVPYILQSIAGGLLAEQAYSGGMRTVILGALLQEAMGIVIAGVFVSATRVVPGLRRYWIRAGLAYGVVIFFVMNYVVVPLSAWRAMRHFSVGEFVANLLAMLLFGVIVAYFAHRQPVQTPMTARSA